MQVILVVPFGIRVKEFDVKDSITGFSLLGSTGAGCKTGAVKNMGLTCKDANMAKSELLLSDFIKLCIEVCEYNGYRVVKK